jgi:eukaryotic-like serine/threonine-protein kinase
MPKMNCWEFMECQREPGGIKAVELGICPAAIAREYDGINRGKNGGRACWACAGTKCMGKASGTFASKFKDCMECPFHNLVKAEEDINFSKAEGLIHKLKSNDKT